jgi:hypothetical protein
MRMLSMLLFFCCCQMHAALGQKPVFQFKLLDSVSGNKLGYATVVLASNPQVGVVADSNGRAAIEAEADNACFVVTAIGYANKKVCPSNDNLVFVRLQPIAHQLEAVVLKPLHEEVWGTTKLKSKVTNGIGDFFSFQFALVIDNPQKRKGYIQEISYYFPGGLFASAPNQDAPFRVRIYAIADSCGCPGKDLLLENLVVRNTKGSGWFAVDLRRFDLAIPPNGFAVAMEWIDSGPAYADKETYTTSAASGEAVRKEVVHYGQKIATSKEKGGTNRTWVKMGISPWVRFVHAAEANVANNAAFKAKVLVE